MSSVVVTEPHSLSADEARGRLTALEEDLAKYRMKLVWKGNSADLKGTGASGDVKVTDSDVTLTIKLGTMAKMAGVKPDLLSKSLQKRLKSALA